MIQPQHRYGDRHFFVDEELKEEGPDSQFALKEAYNTPLSYDDDFLRMREEIQEALRRCDEVALSTLIEQARLLGERYEWQEELDEAEQFMYQITE